MKSPAPIPQNPCREDHDILIQFDQWAADEIRDRRWHSSQQIINLSDGSCQLRLHFSSLEEIEGWILSFGTHATVLQPSVLAERVATIAACLIGKYGSKSKMDSAFKAEAAKMA